MYLHACLLHVVPDCSWRQLPACINWIIPAGVALSFPSIATAIKCMYLYLYIRVHPSVRFKAIYISCIIYHMRFQSREMYLHAYIISVCCPQEFAGPRDRFKRVGHNGDVKPGGTSSFKMVRLLRQHVLFVAC
jgi:hypothetical protein